MMGGKSRGDNSIQAFFSPTPSSSPTKTTSLAIPSLDVLIGDGFTAEEIQQALKPKPVEPWHPATEYTELEIRDLEPGPKAVTFMGRIANIFDLANDSKTPRAAKGCIKLYVKDDRAAITVLYMRDWNVHRWRTDWITGPSLVCEALATCTARILGVSLDNSQYAVLQFNLIPLN
jgi:hypothetical protein